MHANVMNFIYRKFMYISNVIYGVFIQIAFDLKIQFSTSLYIVHSMCWSTEEI